MEARPFASLTASLLARKGAARPAMRRPHHGSAPVPTLPLSVQDDLGWNDMGEDRDDLGPVSPPPLAIVGSDQMVHPAPAYPPVAAPSASAPAAALGQQVETAEDAAGTGQGTTKPSTRSARATPAAALTPGKGRASRKGVGTGATKAATLAAIGAIQPRRTRAAFTLRLDPDRHLRLRLAATLSGRSAQRIVTEALDIFLAGQPDLAALADQIPAVTQAGKGKPE